MSNTGTIVQIIGAVVDADFSNAEKLPAILQTFRTPLNQLIPTIEAAFENDRRFSSLSTPFVELTGFQDNQIWEWLFPEGTLPLP